jgi:hypothetical protein
MKCLFCNIVQEKEARLQYVLACRLKTNKEINFAMNLVCNCVKCSVKLWMRRVFARLDHALSYVHVCTCFFFPEFSRSYQF